MSTLLGAILAGGQGRRMGGDKPQARLAGRRLIDRAVDGLSPQVDDLIILGAEDFGTGRQAIEDDPAIPPSPAAGLSAALQYAGRHNFTRLAVQPVDMPLLPQDWIARLLPGPSMARTKDRMVPTVCVWPAELFRGLGAALRQKPLPALHVISTDLGAGAVAFSEHAMMNINTPQDLERAERLLAQSPRSA